MSYVLAETTLATMLSNCTSFQTYTATTNAAAALARIYRGAVPSPNADEDNEDGTRSQYSVANLYPCAVISRGSYSTYHNATNVSNEYLPAGSVFLQLSHLDDATKTSNELYVIESALWDNIINELWSQTGPGGLDITTINIADEKHSPISERAMRGLEDVDEPRRTRDMSELVLEIVWNNEGGTL